MKRIIQLAAALALLPLASATALADDDDITWDEVPEAVQKTVERMIDIRSIEDIEVDFQNGVVTYEFEYDKQGEEWELEVAADGAVIKHERD